MNGSTIFIHLMHCILAYIDALSKTLFLMSFAVGKTIATALVSSKLDYRYCNSLYYITLKNILKLQLVQNCLARVVTRPPCFSHSVQYWLPVRYHIIFKTRTVTYQALSSKQPAFLHSLLTAARQPRQLQSSNSNLLFAPSVKTNVGTRAFSVVAPTLWNSLPVSRFFRLCSLVNQTVFILADKAQEMLYLRRHRQMHWRH